MTAIAQHSSAPLSVEVHLPSWRRGANGEVLGYRQLAEQLVEHVKVRAVARGRSQQGAFWDFSSFGALGLVGFSEIFRGIFHGISYIYIHK